MKTKETTGCLNKPFVNNDIMVRYSDLYHQTTKAEFGKLKEIVTDELIDMCRGKRHIVIYGHAKSGKIIIGRYLAEALNRMLISSDDYMDLGWEENMYYIRKLIKESNEPLIVEGVQSGRLLRKGCQNGDYFADLVIHIEINRKSLTLCYVQDGEPEKLINDKIFKFNSMLDGIFFEWYKLQCLYFNKRMPTIVNINTSFA